MGYLMNVRTTAVTGAWNVEWPERSDAHVAEAYTGCAPMTDFSAVKMKINDRMIFSLRK
jgi:hypothetical protein